MFNTSVNVRQPDVRTNLSVNAVSGTITKTNAKSFFVYADVGSKVAESLSGRDPYYGHAVSMDPYYGRREKPIHVIVLQAMCVGGGMMYELIDRDDYERVLDDSTSAVTQ